MGIIKWLETIESLKDLGIVRFFAALYRESTFSPLFGWISRVGDGAAGSTARILLLWVVVLTLIVFAIDQVFYFTSPGRIDELRSRLAYLAVRARQVLEGLDRPVKKGKKRRA